MILGGCQSSPRASAKTLEGRRHPLSAAVLCVLQDILQGFEDHSDIHHGSRQVVHRILQSNVYQRSDGIDGNLDRGYPDFNAGDLVAAWD